MTSTASSARFAELVGALTLATDLAAGLAVETALRVCILAVELARALKLPNAQVVHVHDVALLRFIGCSAYSHEVAKVGGGDDLALMTATTCIDAADKGGAVRRVVKNAGRNENVFKRAGVVGRLLVDAKYPDRLARAHCALAVVLGQKLGVDAAVVDGLGHLYARYDGAGFPDASGDGVDACARIVHVAFRAETLRNLEGSHVVKDELQRRSGGELDPDIARAFIADSDRLLTLVDAASVWDRFLDAEPRPHRVVDKVDVIADAFAHYADAKSPYTLDHSQRVAAAADAAAVAMGLSVDDRAGLRIAALLHDVGRCGVPNGIWDKRGALNVVEQQRMREHATLTERVLSTTSLLAPYARIACADHERADGSGYPHSKRVDDKLASILAAADVYAALGEDRPHRRAMSAEAASSVLVAEARAGKLDKACVDAVLAGAGQKPAARLRGEPPQGLSEREVEVLLLVARGLQNKEIAQRLEISAKTVQHHVTHIYEKTKLQGRAAMAIFAIEHGLL